MSNLRSWLWTLLVIEVKCKVCADLGVLVAVVNGSESAFCMRYFSWISPLPSTREAAVLHPLVDLTPSTGCDSEDELQEIDGLDGKVVVVDVPNCTYIQKAMNVQKKGGAGVIVVVPPGPEPPPPSKNESNYGQVNITLGVISENSLQHIKLLGSTVQVLQYALPDDRTMDYSLIIIWFMAMFSIAVGACCSRNVKFYIRKGSILHSGQTIMDDNQPRDSGGNNDDEAPLNVSPTLIVGFVFCMCGMLMMLYFFYDYLVYVIIAMFCVAATLGLYQCLEPLVLILPFCNYRLPSCSRKRCTDMPRVHQVLLFVSCVSLTVSWFVLRRESYSWIMQDILGIAFTVNLLRIARLPSFKICSILLILLFFYDIFFVFITPLFTQNGESVMVEVATGGGSQEQMPMVLKVPHLTLNPLTFCFPRYSLLGFGDILVPGLLVSYCYGFDKDKGLPKLYFASVVAAYGLGLILTFVGLYFMAIAQPALLYLVPCMLAPVTVISVCRKEFWQFWTGNIHLEGYIDHHTDDVHQKAPDARQTLTDGHHVPHSLAQSNTYRDISSNSDIASDCPEDRSLIK